MPSETPSATRRPAHLLGRAAGMRRPPLRSVRPFALAPALHAALRRRDARWRAPAPPDRAVRGLQCRGSRDVLHPDTLRLRLRDRAAAEDIDVTVDLRPGLMHGWAGLGLLPAASAVRRDLVDRLVGADTR